MGETGDRLNRERRMLEDVRRRGLVPSLGVYARLSGPGWLQSAITLGGGSLAGSLYLGVLAGPELLWLQPLAMASGVVMLAAIAHVTLTTGERPLVAIARHVNPVLAWGWLLATLVANVVWCFPQFSLAAAAVQQNLIPSFAGEWGTAGACAVTLLAAVSVVWLYDSGGRGIALFEAVLKGMVGLIVLSFFGVAAVVLRGGGLEWGAVARGFVPDPSLLFEPATGYRPFLAALDSGTREWWAGRIVADQRAVMVTAAATAVGVNMTFLLPYSMLAKGWDRSFRGLAKFDLLAGLLLPFVLATSCVVVAAASRLHARPDAALSSGAAQAPPRALAGFERLLALRLAEGPPTTAAELPRAERELASMLVRRDAFDLADALTPLAGETMGQIVFGVGVLAMAISTAIVLMLISGFATCELLGRDPRGPARRWGSLLPAVGVLGPFVWQGEARFWLAVPTSVFGMILLPIAYLSFLVLVNRRALLGDARPRGWSGALWNAAMAAALALSSLGAAWSLWSSAGWWGVAAAGVFALAALGAHRASEPAPRAR